MGGWVVVVGGGGGIQSHRGLQVQTADVVISESMEVLKVGKKVRDTISKLLEMMMMEFE